MMKGSQGHTKKQLQDKLGAFNYMHLSWGLATITCTSTLSPFLTAAVRIPFTSDPQPGSVTQ